MSQFSNRDGREKEHVSDGEKEEDKCEGRMDIKGRSTELLERAEKELFETQLQLKAKVRVHVCGTCTCMYYTCTCIRVRGVSGVY